MIIFVQRSCQRFRSVIFICIVPVEQYCVIKLYRRICSIAVVGTMLRCILRLVIFWVNCDLLMHIDRVHIKSCSEVKVMLDKMVSRQDGFR